MDDLRRARAILGVPEGATPEQLRARYRELVKQWHPDRYASDPQGQLEAEGRMREINVAFDRLLAASALPHVSDGPAASGGPPRVPVPGQRLTREQIDRMVASIGSPNPIEEMLSGLPRGRLEGISDVSVIASVVLLAWVGVWSLLGSLGLGDLPAALLALPAAVYVGRRLSRMFRATGPPRQK